MFPKDIFGKRIAYLRNCSGLSQEALGNKFDVTKATISRIESADRAPSADLIYALADYFDVPLDFLTGRGLYAQWEELRPFARPILEALQDILRSNDVSLDIPQSDADCEMLLIRLMPAILSRITINQDHTISLFPLLSVEKVIEAN
jgi:transcriptional regulator with XRE-family HTH domain